MKGVKVIPDAPTSLDELVVSKEVAEEAQINAKADSFRAAVDKEKYQRLVRRTAAEELLAEERGPGGGIVAGTLREFQSRPTPPPDRIYGWMKTDGLIIVVAQAKTGKSTLLLNLARSLITGEEFLADAKVVPIVGSVGYLNFEMSDALLTQWATDIDLDPDRFYVASLRNRRSPFDHPSDRSELARLLREHNVETLMVDTFTRAFTGDSQNDSTQVGRFLSDLTRFAHEEVGASDVVLTAHAGHQGERARGSSELAVACDSTILMTIDDSGTRYISATGRDVDVAEDGLLFDPRTRILTLANTGDRRLVRKARKTNDLVDPVVKIVKMSPGLNGTEVGQLLHDGGHSLQRGDEYKALHAAEEDGLIYRIRGKHGADLWHPTANDE